MPRTLNHKNLLCFLGFFFALAFPTMAQTVSEPPYTLIKSEHPFELRAYAPMVIAETHLEGDFDVAGSLGFRRVAGYIFGKNQNVRGESEKIAMTAPVTMEAQSQQWRLHFVMPQGTSLATLPQPIDHQVQLRELPAQRMAAVRFSGLTTAASIAHNTQRLRDWLMAQNISFEDRPQVARYNDPFTLPWNRRNEILLLIH